MNQLDIQNKVSYLREGIEECRTSTDPIHKMVVANWEDSLLDSLSDLDFLKVQKSPITLKVQLDGGIAENGGLPIKQQEYITKTTNYLLNEIAHRNFGNSKKINLEISRVENCCTLISINSTEDRTQSIVNKSIIYLINALKILKEREYNLDLMFLNNEAIIRIKELFSFIVANNFDLKFIAQADTLVNQVDFNLSGSKKIVEG